VSDSIKLIQLAVKHAEPEFGFWLAEDQGMLTFCNRTVLVLFLLSDVSV
jgi:hypothetical protein